MCALWIEIIIIALGEGILLIFQVKSTILQDNDKAIKI